MDLGELLVPDDSTSPYRIGVVAAVSPLTVRVGAASSPVACRRLSSYSPAVADVVVVLVSSSDRVVLGSTTAGTNEYRYSNTGQFFSWYDGSSRIGYLQGNNPGGIALNSEIGQLTFSAASGKAFMPGNISLGNSGLYGGYYGLHYSPNSNYLMMTDGTNTLVSTPSATGYVSLRSGVNGAYLLQLNPSGNHSLVGNIDHGGYSISGVADATLSNHLNMGGSYIVASDVYGMHVHPAVNTGIDLRLGEYYSNPGVYGASGYLNIGAGTSGFIQMSARSRDPGGGAYTFVVGDNIQANFANGGGTWGGFQLILHDTGTAQVGMAGLCNSNSWAPVWRVNPANGVGERWDSVANGLGSYARIAASAYDTISTQREKRDITAISDADILGRLELTQAKRWLPRIGPSQIVGDESEEHDCHRHDCAGSGDAPCSITLNHRTGTMGLVAEDHVTAFPEHVNVDPDGIPHSIDTSQVAATALGSAAALLRYVRTLEARLATLEGS